MDKIILLCLTAFFAYSCDKDKFNDDLLKWSWLESNKYEASVLRTVHEELFGNNRNIRHHQSMSLYDNKAFCFNDGLDCNVFDVETKEEWLSETLPQSCHHNNAQFLDLHYDSKDKYPLLLLSRGDYPPDQNEFYIIRVTENNGSIFFNKIKTIRNTLLEAQNNGSWIADTKNKKLYMYSMTKGDWRVKENNYFCIYTFELPDILDESDVILDYKDVQNFWQYPYLIHQGGTLYNGYLLFNVQGICSVGDTPFESSFNVLAINVDTGVIDIVLPLDTSMETEGISVYNEKLYISFKDGSPDQRPENIVFRLNEYTLPISIVNQK